VIRNVALAVIAAVTVAATTSTQIVTLPISAVSVVAGVVAALAFVYWEDIAAVLVGDAVIRPGSSGTAPASAANRPRAQLTERNGS
jgi:hypothetical protein